VCQLAQLDKSGRHASSLIRTINQEESHSMTIRKIPMASPDLTPDDIKAVQQVLRTPHLSMGPQIAAFEQGFAEYVGTRHAIGVSSGTAGLHLCVIAAGVVAGDLVLTTPFSFISSANCILFERAIPIFVDIDPLTLNLDPDLAAQAAEDLVSVGRNAQQWLPPAMRNSTTAVRRPKAILPVDVFGQTADYDAIHRASKKHGMIIIEDSCEAIGAEYKGRKAGTLGDAAVFAFYPNKQMTTGEGGMIVTERDDWAALFRSLRNQGRDESGTWLNHIRLGYNYRMDEMSAALGTTQLARIDRLLQERERVAQMYAKRLCALEGVSTPHVAPTSTRISWFVYVVRLAPELSRNAVMSHLHDQGISCRPYFSPIHLQPFYVEKFGYKPGDFPVTEAVANSTLALPFHGRMDEETVDTVFEGLRRALREAG
jgi:dTDP-4-amino-4,6-dideoxygalactose transaminase